ncbi:hypothetical protein AMK27_12485 [Streptomyces sp. CB02009]|nr:hypothetical protein AMK27_12485 [Streptomyces sp. CB02009]
MFSSESVVLRKAVALRCHSVGRAVARFRRAAVLRPRPARPPPDRGQRSFASDSRRTAPRRAGEKGRSRGQGGLPSRTSDTGRPTGGGCAPAPRPRAPRRPRRRPRAAGARHAAPEQGLSGSRTPRPHP